MFDIALAVINSITVIVILDIAIVEYVPLTLILLASFTNAHNPVYSISKVKCDRLPK